MTAKPGLGRPGLEPGFTDYSSKNPAPQERRDRVERPASRPRAPGRPPRAWMPGLALPMACPSPRLSSPCEMKGMI